MAIRDLASHTAHYVTVTELAEYWAVSRQQIYKRIESGALDAICLGSRLYRVRTAGAVEYERRASVNGAGRKSQVPPVASGPAPSSDKFPKKISLRRVR